jgi:hypothetical protein
MLGPRGLVCSSRGRRPRSPSLLNERRNRSVLCWLSGVGELDMCDGLRNGVRVVLDFTFFVTWIDHGIPSSANS